MTPADIDRILAEMGIVPRPAPAPAPATTARLAGPACDWAGVWYPDAEIPF